MPGHRAVVLAQVPGAAGLRVSQRPDDVLEAANGGVGAVGHGDVRVGQKIGCGGGEVRTIIPGAFNRVYFRNPTQGVKSAPCVLPILMSGGSSWGFCVGFKVRTRFGGKHHENL